MSDVMTVVESPSLTAQRPSSSEVSLDDRDVRFALLFVTALSVAVLVTGLTVASPAVTAIGAVNVALAMIGGRLVAALRGW